MSQKTELSIYYNIDIHKKLWRPINCLKLKETEALWILIEVVSSYAEASSDSWSISLIFETEGVEL